MSGGSSNGSGRGRGRGRGSGRGHARQTSGNPKKVNDDKKKDAA